MINRTKILAVVGILILIGGLLYLRSGRSEITVSKVTPAQAKKAVEVLSRDQDEDGLKDWEEELWKTDALKADSDGDGTSDGEEVKEGRDPTKPAPDDKLDRETIEKKTVPGGGDWSETDRLSREFFAKYLSIKQSGAPFTAAEEEKLLADFIARYPEQKPRKIYTESDITVSEKNDDEALKAYGNAIGTVIQKHKENEAGENELIIFERALGNEDPIDLANLDGRVKRYESLFAGFKSIPAPKSAVPSHIDLLNAIESLKESVAGMAGAFSDSVRALSSATAYPAAVEKLTKAFDDIKNLLVQRKIVFGKDEPGRILTR